MDLYVFPIPIPPPTSLSTWFLWVFPVHHTITLYAKQKKSHRCTEQTCFKGQSVQFLSRVSNCDPNSLSPHGLQHTRLRCPSPAPGAFSNSGPSSQWCHPTISFSVVPFSSCLQSFPASGSFLLSQFFPSGGQSIGASASASVLPVNIQDWFTLGLTGLISLQPKGLSRVFSNTTVQNH